MPQPQERVLDRRRVGEQVAEHHHQRPVPEHRGHLHEAPGNVGFSRRLDLREHREHMGDLRPPRAGRQGGVELLVEYHQAAGILLVNHQPAEGGRQRDRVVEFGELLPVGVGHRRAGIDREVAGDVGLGLKLLHIVLVGLGVDQPVDVLRVVARGVLAVLAELDREALVGTGMEPLQEALDDELGAEIEPGDLPHHLGLQVFLDRAGHQQSLLAAVTSRASESPARASRGAVGR